MPGVGLALLDQCLHAPLDDRVALTGRQFRVEVTAYSLGHIVHLHRHVHPRPWRRGQFIRRGSRQKPVFEVVVAAARMKLQGTVRAVMIGNDEAAGGNERRRAVPQRDHGGHRERRQVGEFVRLELQAGGAQVGGDSGKLAGSEHALGGRGGAGEDSTTCGEHARGCVHCKSPDFQKAHDSRFCPAYCTLPILWRVAASHTIRCRYYGAGRGPVMNAAHTMERLP